MSAIGALARFTFDAAVLVYVRTADTAGAAMSEGLTGREEGRRNESEDDFHIKIIFSR